MSRISRVLILLTVATYCSVVNCEQNASVTATSRAGRQMDIPRDLRVVRIFLDQHQHLRRPPQISARSDHFPQRLGPGVYGRPPFGRPPPQQPMPHIRRRVHAGPPGPPPPGVFLRPNGPPQYNYYQSFKNSRYPLAKSPYAQKGAPVNYYRQEQAQVAPNLNAIPQGPNFKPSPIYNGEVIVRHPSAAPLIAAPPSARPPQQIPIPQSNEKLDALRQHNARPVMDPHHMYSVYEDTDNEQENSYPQPNIGENAMNEAKQYLNFMSSSEYFLPKIEPDYRKLDQVKQHQQQQQQQSESAAISVYQQQQHQQQQQQQHQQQQQQQRKSDSGSLNAAFTVNAPLRVSASPSPPQAGNTISPTSTYSSRHPAQSNLGSQQPDGNVFVVSSDGIKNVHHIVSSSSYPKANQQQHGVQTYSSALSKDRVPDPERVEFTERDAIHVSYTSNPMDSMSRYGEQHQLQHQQHQQQQQQQQSQPDRRYIKPSAAIQDEDDEEMMQAASDVYGRIKVNPSETVSNPSIEQKDTEEYCERICSNVQDEDEEVVCGSDGFMYTSEAQMECYASCLHIDVTIQSKGTCNQPL